MPTPVAQEEDLTRYCGGAHFDADTGEVNGSAFDRNPKDIDGVSVTRCRFFSDVIEDDQNEIRRVVGSRLKFGKTAIFVELNTGDLLDALAEFEQEISVIQDPLPAQAGALPNPAHALIIGFPFRGEAIGSLKSELAGDRLRRIILRRFPAIINK
jgi:hypothetical protein